MTTFCPRCGQAGRDESVVTPLVSVWASCERCHFVWRASLLDTVKGFAARGARLTLGERVVGHRSSVQPIKVDTVQPVSADHVAEWLASQEKSATLKLAPVVHVEDESDTALPAASDPVEAFFNRLEPADAPAHHEPVAISAESDFYAFFVDDAAVEPPASAMPEAVEQWIGEETPVAAPPIVEPPVTATPLENSVDRALTNVEDLYDAFKRLEQQLGGMEKWCAELANR